MISHRNIENSVTCVCECLSRMLQNEREVNETAHQKSCSKSSKKVFGTLHEFRMLVALKGIAFRAQPFGTVWCFVSYTNLVRMEQIHMKVGYVRISTKEQNTARQDVLMEELGVEKIYTDKLSGKNTDRPELHKMMDFVREGDVVIVESFSRFARNTRDLLDLTAALTEKGVQFISKKESIDTSTPAGKLMLTMFAALAEFERETLLERQAEGIAVAKAEGRMTGRPQKAVDTFEAVYQEVKAGKKSAAQGARELGIARSTWYRKTKRYEEGQVVDFG